MTPGLGLNLQLGRQRTGETSAVGLHVQLGDDAILDDHRVALGANTAQWWQINGQIDLLGEGRLRIGQETDLALGFVFLAPGGQHEGIVDGHANDLGHAGSLQFVGLLQVAGQMGLSEWNRERHKDYTLPKCITIRI